MKKGKQSNNAKRTNEAGRRIERAGRFSGTIFICAISLLLFFSGCGSGSAENSASNEGTYSLTVSWPDQNSDSERVIPQGSSSISVMITGAELTNPVTTSITTSETSVAFSLPTGQKVATIKALDSSGNITAQRKESFVILADQTVTSEHIPLGAAIVGTDSIPVLEPSDIKLSSGDTLYVQNWLESDVLVEGLNNDAVTLDGASQGTDEKWSFPETARIFNKNCRISLNEGNFDYEAALYQPAGERYEAVMTINGKDSSNSGLTIPWGVGVDRTNGVVYIADTCDFCIKKFSLTGTFITKWGGSLNSGGDGKFIQIQSVRPGPDGAVYAGDSDLGKVFKYTSAGTFVTKWGGRGSGDGKFYGARSIAFDQNGNVLVADVGGNRIQKFTSNGIFLTKFGSYGTGNGQFNNPWGVSVSKVAPYYVYVADNGNHRIQKFDSSLCFLTAWGGYGAGNSNLNGPRGMSLADDGSVFVADFSNNYIKKFDSSGTYLTKWGSSFAYSANAGELCSPVDVDLDSSGNFFSLEHTNARVQRFNQSGTVLTWWGTDRTKSGVISMPYKPAVDSGGNIYVPEIAGNKIQVFKSDGTFKTKWGVYGTSGGDAELWAPRNLALDSAGNIYVNDHKSAIRKYSSIGNLITKYSSVGSADGQLAFPYHSFVDTSGYIYVADYSNNRIQKFNSAFVFQSKWGSVGTGSGNLKNPISISMDSTGNFYVLDYTNTRVVKFNFSSATPITMWGVSGSGFGQLSTPSDLCLDSDGYVFVVCAGKIVKFTSSGTFVTEIDLNNNNQVTRGITFDTSGNIYVSDSNFNRIIKFAKR